MHCSALAAVATITASTMSAMLCPTRAMGGPEPPKRSGSAAGRAAERLQPLSLTHVAQVRSSWTINNPVNANLRPGLAQVLEETPPPAEQHGRQGDFKLVHDTHVQVLLAPIGCTRDTN